MQTHINVNLTVYTLFIFYGAVIITPGAVFASQAIVLSYTAYFTVIINEACHDVVFICLWKCDFSLVL